MNRTLLLIFICALAVRGVLFSVNFTHNNFDLIETIHCDDGYYELSQSILHGEGMSGNPLRPPLWPAIIAFTAYLFGYWGVLVLELLLASFIPILGALLSRVLVGDKFSHYVGWLMVFSPYPVLLSFILYSETAFTFFFLISLIFLFKYFQPDQNQSLRTKFIALSALFLGLATLIKPTVQFFPIIIPIITLSIYRREITKPLIKQMALYGCIFLVIMAPWFYRNYSLFGVWGISAQPVFNLYVYLVPTVLSIDNDTNFATELNNFVTKDGFDVNTINLANQAVFKAKALAELKNHKTALIKSVVVTIITFLTHDGLLTLLQYSGVTIVNTVHKPAIFLLLHPIDFILTVYQFAKSPAILIIIMRGIWVFISTLLFFGLYKFIKQQGLSINFLLASLIVAYFALTTSINGLGVNARFRVPVEVLIFSFAIYGFFAIKERILDQKNT